MVKRTGRIAVLGAWLTAAALCFASSAQAAKLVVSSQPGTAGSQGTFTVSLQAEGAKVAGTQNDTSFDPAKIPVAAKASGKPDCAVNVDIDKGATSFAFRPAGCSGATCTGVRALVLSTGDVAPILDGSVMYTCKINIAAGVTGSFPLTCSAQGGSNPDGVAFNGQGKVCSGNGITGCTTDADCTTVKPPLTMPAGGTCSVTLPQLGCTSGQVTVGVIPTHTPTPMMGGDTPTNTPTNTATATRTATPSPPPPTITQTRTVTPPPTNTPTRTNTPITNPTAAPTSPSDDDGGCQISTAGSSSAGWLVLIPAVGLLVMRRRRR
jgi:MYXO-CTERM domain-containing protein